jgi:hypothetical protein
MSIELHKAVRVVVTVLVMFALPVSEVSGPGVSSTLDAWAADQGAITAEDLAPPGANDESDGVEKHSRYEEGGSGSKQVVKLNNRVDGRLRVKGDIELNILRGDRVTPLNLAQARAECVGCSTFAVALQLDIYKRGADVVAPVNRSIALNEQCLRCITVARAIQYVIPVDDPEQIPERVDGLIRELDRELQDIQRDSNGISAREANRRLQVVIDQFNDIGGELRTATVEQLAESGSNDSDAPAAPQSKAASPTPTATPSPTLITEALTNPAEVTATPTATPSPTLVTEAPTNPAEATATPTPESMGVAP